MGFQYKQEFQENKMEKICHLSLFALISHMMVKSIEFKVMTCIASLKNLNMGLFGESNEKVTIW